MLHAWRGLALHLCPPKLLPLLRALSACTPPPPSSWQFPDLDNLFCRYSFSHGPDWRVCQGIDQGFSQVARKSSGGDASVVWNFPIDVTFKSTNAFGWPRLVVSVYSQVRGPGRPS